MYWEYIPNGYAKIFILKIENKVTILFLNRRNVYIQKDNLPEFLSKLTFLRTT